jgi:hypothetical protein
LQASEPSQSNGCAVLAAEVITKVANGGIRTVGMAWVIVVLHTAALIQMAASPKPTACRAFIFCFPKQMRKLV